MILRPHGLAPSPVQSKEVSTALGAVSQPAIPFVQIRNIGERLSTRITNKSRFEVALSNMNSVQHQEKLADLINIMFGFKSFQCDDEAMIESTPCCSKSERFFIRAAVTAACQANVKLFKVKAAIAELVALDNKAMARNSIRNAQRVLKYAVSTFLTCGMEYYYFLNKLNSPNKDELLKELTINQIYDSHRKVERAKKSFSQAESEWRKTKTLSDENEALKMFSTFFSKKWFCSIFTGIFTELSSHQLQDIVKTATRQVSFVSEKPSSTSVHSSDEPLPSTSGCVGALVTQHELLDKGFEFKKIRKPVTKNLSESLLEKVTLAKFHEFILTNWKLEYTYKLALTSNRIDAISKQDSTSEYNILLKSFFQKKMRLNAISFVKNALTIKNIQIKLNNLEGHEKARIANLRVRRTSLYQLSFVVQNNIYSDHTEYLKRKALAPSLSKVDLKAKIVKLVRENISATQAAKYREDKFGSFSSDDLMYIGCLLNFIRQKPNFCENDIIEFSKSFLELKEQEQIEKNLQTSVPCLTKRAQHLTQSDEPASKKVAISTSTIDKRSSVSFLPLSEDKEKIVQLRSLNNKNEDATELSASFATPVLPEQNHELSTRIQFPLNDATSSRRVEPLVQQTEQEKVLAEADLLLADDDLGDFFELQLLSAQNSIIASPLSAVSIPQVTEQNLVSLQSEERSAEIADFIDMDDVINEYWEGNTFDENWFI